jgi:hypothetical protein
MWPKTTITPARRKVRFKAFPVFDLDTGVDCTAGQRSPHKVTQFLRDLRGDTSRISPVKIGEVVILECVDGSWVFATYDMYVCADKTRRIALPSTAVTRTTTPCSDPPPRPPGV